MKKNLIISYDLGTSGNKATLFDFDGNLIAKSFKSYKTFYNSPGFAEQSQKDWWQSVTFTTADLLQKVPNSAKNLCAVTFSGQMMGCCPIDNEGTPIFNAIIWSDQRSYKEKELLREKITDDFAYKKTGNIVCANYLATKVMWLKANYPEIYKKTFKFLQAKDYIAYLLTGKTYTDYSDASGTNLFDIENKKWCNEIINASGISLNKLPEIVPATTIIGKVRKDVAETIKLPAGLPVVIGGGDGPCATVGAGASFPNSCYNIFGSSSWISLTTQKPLFDKYKRIFILNHLDPGLYMSLGTMQSAGTSIEWISDWIFDNSSIDFSNRYKKLDQFGCEAEIGSRGILFLPYLMGERSPYWDTEVRGAFLGLTKVVGKKEIIRSVMEGVIYHLRIILEVLEENTGNISEIRLIGGGGKSKFLQELMANIWGKNVIPMQHMEEATSIGAAIAALVALGVKKNFYEGEVVINKAEVVKPDLIKYEKYSQLFNIFKDAYISLKKINNQLSIIASHGQTLPG